MPAYQEKDGGIAQKTRMAGPTRRLECALDLSLFVSLKITRTGACLKNSEAKRRKQERTRTRSAEAAPDPLPLLSRAHFILLILFYFFIIYD